MLIQQQSFVYDEAHYRVVAYEMAATNENPILVEKLLEFEELLNHISTVFYSYSSELGEIQIEVGKEDSRLQALMKERGIVGIAGLTPKFPIQNRQATDLANTAYVAAFRNSLETFQFRYLEAKGRARDFREGGDGCFLLIDITPGQVMKLLGKTQLSFTYLPQCGQARLISCVEPEPPEPNPLTECIKLMTFKERAAALSFLGEALAEEAAEFSSPRNAEFYFLMKNQSKDSKLKMLTCLTKLLTK